MRTKIDRKRTMVTASYIRDETLPMLSALVRRAHYDHGSKMAAYDAIGSRIGASGSWVRKFVGRQSVGLDGHVLDNIRALHARLCSTIDAASDAIEADTTRMREDRLAREAAKAGSRDPRLVAGEDQERSS